MVLGIFQQKPLGKDMRGMFHLSLGQGHRRERGQAGEKDVASQKNRNLLSAILDRHDG